MCVVAVKYFDKFGWCGAKNRDRNYRPTIAFKRSTKNGVESLYMTDEITKYSEGINEYGVCILNAATAVKNDESEAADARRKKKEAAKRDGAYYAPDGVKIRKALKFKTALEAANHLIETEMMGNTLIFSKETCYLLEGGKEEKEFTRQKELSFKEPEREWDKVEYYHELTEIKKTEFVVRTNHGQILPWMGYQSGTPSPEEAISRKGSETRHDVAYAEVKKATSPQELLEAISVTSNKDSQLNPVRRSDPKDRKLLKTTGQLFMKPYELSMSYIPIYCHTLGGSFDRINNKDVKCSLNILAFKSNDFKEYLKQRVGK